MPFSRQCQTMNCIWHIRIKQMVSNFLSLTLTIIRTLSKWTQGSCLQVCINFFLFLDVSRRTFGTLLVLRVLNISSFTVNHVPLHSVILTSTKDGFSNQEKFLFMNLWRILCFILEYQSSRRSERPIFPICSAGGNTEMTRMFYFCSMKIWKMIWKV